MSQLRSGRVRAAHAQMKRIVYAMVGAPGSSAAGYVGDMGSLPPSLQALNDGTGLPAYGFNATDGVGYGWAGPYLPELAAPRAPLVDPWNRSYRYRSSRAQVTSAGPDRRFGTADDLTFPPSPLPASGNVTVTVLGVPRTGGPAQQLDSSRAAVFLASSVGGRRRERLLSGVGPFTATALHLGPHAVRAQGRLNYSGAVARDVVVVGFGTALVTLTLDEP